MDWDKSELTRHGHKDHTDNDMNEHIPPTDPPCEQKGELFETSVRCPPQTLEKTDINVDTHHYEKDLHPHYRVYYIVRTCP